ncbi:MAG: LysM peptidoglycan-binding domain-containing protein [Pseudomonadota bacterium]
MRVGFIFLLLAGFIFAGDAAVAITPSKTFVIKTYLGQEVLCGPYIVRQNEYISEILHRKGVLAERDWLSFVAILKKLNPQIKDINRIYPGQEIIIPLRYVKSGEVGKLASSITIPVIPDVLYRKYKVAPGDSVSKILAREYGVDFGEVTDQQRVAFQKANPSLKNLNSIYAGQQLNIPTLRTSDKAKSDNPREGTAIVSPSQVKERADDGMAAGDSLWSKDVVSSVMKSLDGDMLCTGSYFFPRKNGGWHSIDLSMFSVVEMADGKRVLIDSGRRLSDEIRGILASFWGEFEVVDVNKENVTTKGVLNDIVNAIGGALVESGKSIRLSDGMSVVLRGDQVYSRKNEEGEKSVCVTYVKGREESTDLSVVSYLESHGIQVIDISEEVGGNEPHELSSLAGPGIIELVKTDRRLFVKELFKMVGIRYIPSSSITLSYGGFDTSLSVDLGAGRDGEEFIVDFDSSYGDIGAMVRDAGIKIVEINKNEDYISIAKKALTVSSIPFKENPVFFTAKREASRTISIAVPGLLVLPKEKRLLLVRKPIHVDLSHFLKDKSLQIVVIGNK